MSSASRLRVGLLIPSIALVVAATMLPAGLRVPSASYIDYTFSPPDFVNNILLFIPFGIALGGTSLLRAFLLGLGLSTCAEVLQLGYIDRIPSPFDVISNTSGAVIGYLLASVWRRVTGRRPLQAIYIPKLLACLGLPAAAAGVFLLVHHRTSSDLSNWDPSFQFAIGHELTGERPWNGTVSRVELIPAVVPAAALSQDSVAAASVRLMAASSTQEGGTPVLETSSTLRHWDLQTLSATATVPSADALPGKSAQQQDLYAALQRSNQFTLLVWMRTHSLAQSGPARIVTYSRDPMNRNFTLGQIQNTLTFRLRTPASGSNGTNPALFSGPVLKANQDTFVAVVYDGRIVNLYVNGKHVAQSDLGAKKPRLPGRLLAKIPRSLPIPEIESTLSEILLSCLFALGLLAVMDIPARLPLRLLIGAAAGFAVGAAIWTFGVSAPTLGLLILSECVLAGMATGGSVSFVPVAAEIWGTR